jgi:hypothetical protein
MDRRRRRGLPHGECAAALATVAVSAGISPQALLRESTAAEVGRKQMTARRRHHPIHEPTLPLDLPVQHNVNSNVAISQKDAPTADIWNCSLRHR